MLASEASWHRVAGDPEAPSGVEADGKFRPAFGAPVLLEGHFRGAHQPGLAEAAVQNRWHEAELKGRAIAVDGAAEAVLMTWAIVEISRPRGEAEGWTSRPRLGPAGASPSRQQGHPQQSPF